MARGTDLLERPLRPTPSVGELGERPAWEVSLVAPAAPKEPRRLSRSSNDRPERSVPAGSLLSSADARRLHAAASTDYVSATRRLAGTVASSTNASPSVRAPATSTVTPDAPTFSMPPTPHAWDESQRPSFGGIFPAPPWAGGHAPPPGRESVPVARRGSSGFFGPGGFYGNYVGWGEQDEGVVLLPVSPLDLVALYHDSEYSDVQTYYGATDNRWVSWFEPFWRFDAPQFTYDLAMADLRFNENSFTFIARGIDQGFYRGAPGLLIADLGMATIAWVWHSTLAAIRLGVVYPTQVIFGGLWDTLTGKITIGEYFRSLVEGAANLLTGAAYFVAGTARGLWNLGTSAVNAVLRDPVKVLGGAAIGAAVGSIFGPVGSVVGGIVGGIIGGDGCFLTTAACEQMGLPDDHALLQTFRAYRDEYLAKRPRGRQLVEEYYRLSPAIVEALATRGDRHAIYSGLFHDFILPAYASIRVGRWDTAYRIYRRMLESAARTAGLSSALHQNLQYARVYDDKLWLS